MSGITNITLLRENFPNDYDRILQICLNEVIQQCDEVILKPSQFISRRSLKSHTHKLLPALLFLEMREDYDKIFNLVNEISENEILSEKLLKTFSDLRSNITQRFNLRP